jgi:hypothetical protein
MALKTKIKLKVDHDYKLLQLASMTGDGITGYGSNQDPVGYREAASNGVDIIKGRFVITSPSGTVTKISVNAPNAYDIASQFGDFIAEVNNIQLGYSADEQLEDGLWKFEYIEFFPNDNAVTISYSTSTNIMTYNSLSNFVSFKNANYIYLASDMTTIDETYLHKITTSVVSTSTNIVTDKVAYTTASNQYGYRVGYSAVKYIPVARSIKECLDNKIADLVECECDEVDAELVNKYLLYDAMFVNCEIDNINKAQQIFDLLSKYCDDNCGCD